MSKAQAQHSHATRRAKSRYGLNFNKFLRKEFVNKIQSGRATFIRRSSNRVSIFMIEHNGGSYPVVYDKIRKTIVTFLPEDFHATRQRHVW